MKVLLTSSGRRTSLLKAFKEALSPYGGSVFAGDIDGLAPTLFLADKALILLPINNEGYLDSLLDIIVKEEIRLLVPTIDTELEVLSKNKDKFLEKGCTPLISSPKTIDITFDKWTTATFFTKRGIKVPASWLPEKINFRDLPEKLFIKPRRGSASQHTYKVNKRDLEKFLDWVPDPIIQEELTGPEITVDALLDFSGNLIHYVPRKRIRTLAGESIQGQTIDDTEIRTWLCTVFGALGHSGAVGPITIQFFHTERGPTLTEVNPRFGGGFPLANAAGGHYPRWIIQMLYGEKTDIKIGQYKKGLFMTRYYEEIFIEEGNFKW